MSLKFKKVFRSVHTEGTNDYADALEVQEMEFLYLFMRYTESRKSGK